jgi:hypothetical protein
VRAAADPPLAVAPRLLAQACDDRCAQLGGFDWRSGIKLLIIDASPTIARKIRTIIKVPNLVNDADEA